MREREAKKAEALRQKEEAKRLKEQRQRESNEVGMMCSMAPASVGCSAANYAQAESSDMMDLEARLAALSDGPYIAPAPKQ